VTVSSYFLPASVPEALGLLGEHGPELLVIAGGTVAMPLINEGISLPGRVMGLRRAGLDRVERAGAELRVGATATLTQLVGQGDVPLLAEAASRTASWSVRNMATVGGNLFTPPPGGDVATALLALDARVVVAGPAGERTLPLTAFWTGFMTTALASDELVTSIIVPLDEGRTAFLKFGRRRANTPAVVTVAAHATLEHDRVVSIRLALGAAAPHPVRLTRAEAVVAGSSLEPAVIDEAAALAAEDADPVADAVASDWYRRRMTGVFVRRILEQLAGRAGRDA
jgi:CO/xanthine dehydrogenase FAD-binding subunit